LLDPPVASADVRQLFNTADGRAPNLISETRQPGSTERAEFMISLVSFGG
jgi:hypothetical protein